MQSRKAYIQPCLDGDSNSVVCDRVAMTWQSEKNMVTILSPQCIEAEKHLSDYPHSACQSFLCPAARSSPGSLVFVALSRSLD